MRPRRGLPHRPWPGRLAADRSGVAALEFALLAPIMLAALMGTVELTNAVRVQQKLTLAAGQLAEIIASQPAVVAGDASGQSDKTAALADMCAGAALNLYPYDTSGVSANVASVTNTMVAGGLAPTQDWETDTACGSTATHMAAASLTALANTPRSVFTGDGTPWSGTAGDSNLVSGFSAVVVSMHYAYGNILPFLLGAHITLSATAVGRPRNNSAIPCTSISTGAACPPNP